jgi:hypothetical protein
MRISAARQIGSGKDRWQDILTHSIVQQVIIQLKSIKGKSNCMVRALIMLPGFSCVALLYFLYVTRQQETEVLDPGMSGKQISFPVSYSLYVC